MLLHRCRDQMALEIMRLLTPTPVGRSEMLARRVAALAPSMLRTVPRVASFAPEGLPACDPELYDTGAKHTEPELYDTGAMHGDSEFYRCTELDATGATFGDSELYPHGGTELYDTGAKHRGPELFDTGCPHGGPEYTAYLEIGASEVGDGFVAPSFSSAGAASGGHLPLTPKEKEKSGPTAGIHLALRANPLPSPDSVPQKKENYEVDESTARSKAHPPVWPSRDEVIQRFLDDIEGVGFRHRDVQAFLSECRDPMQRPARVEIDEGVPDFFIRSLLNCMFGALPSELQACVTAVRHADGEW